MRLNRSVRILTLTACASLAALPVAPSLSRSFGRHFLHSAVPGTAAVPAPDLGRGGISLVHGAMAGALASSSSAPGDLPSGPGWHRASPFDRNFAALLEAKRKASLGQREGQSFGAKLRGALGLSGGAADGLREESVLDAEFGEISVDLDLRLGWAQKRASRRDPGNGPGAFAEMVRAFEAGMAVALARSQSADSSALAPDYARAPIGVNTSAGGGTIVISAPSSASWTSPSTETWAASAPADPNWSVLPASAPVNGRYHAGSLGGGSLIVTPSVSVSPAPNWNNYAAGNGQVTVQQKSVSAPAVRVSAPTPVQSVAASVPAGGSISSANLVSDVSAAAPAHSGPTSTLYLTAGDENRNWRIPAGTTTAISSAQVETAPAGEYAIAVSNGTVRTGGNGQFGPPGLGSTYNLNFNSVGPRLANPGNNILDGTTDGTFNYGVNWVSKVVYRCNLDWSSPTVLFTASAVSGSVFGVSYSAANNSLWIGDSSGQIFDYSLGGTVLSSFATAGSANLALAYDGADGTLWSESDFGSGNFNQYSTTGAVLQTLTFATGDDNIIGGEFALVPEPSSALLLLGSGAMCLLRRRRAVA